MFYPFESLTSRRFSQGALLLLASVVLTACGTFSGVDPVTRETGIKKPGELIVILETRKAAIDTELDAAKQQQMRNELQNQIIRLSDVACDGWRTILS